MFEVVKIIYIYIYNDI